MKNFKQLVEKTLTKAEKRKREEIAKAIERDNPDMPMDKKMAIATATAKKVAENNISKVSDLKEGSHQYQKGDVVIATTGPHKGHKHEVIHVFGDDTYNVKPIGLSPNRIRYSLGAAKAKGSQLKAVKEEVDNDIDEARVISGGYRDKSGKYHPPKTADDYVKDAIKKRVERRKAFADVLRTSKQKYK